MIAAVINASRKLQQLRDRAVSLEDALARFRATQGGARGMKTREYEGISGWQALCVIATSVMIMAVTFFLAPQ